MALLTYLLYFESELSSPENLQIEISVAFVETVECTLCEHSIVMNEKQRRPPNFFAADAVIIADFLLECYQESCFVFTRTAMLQLNATQP